MKIIDSHCHLDGFVESGALGDVLTRAKNALVDVMVAVGTEYKDWKVQSELAMSHDNIYYTVGLHPLNTEKEADLDKIDDFFSLKERPIAIGEIGLDYHRLSEDEDEKKRKVDWQKKIFSHQLAFAKKMGLPVIIHSRDAFDDTLRAIESAKIEPNNVVFHCFGYGEQEVDVLKKQGYFVSFSGTVTFKRFEIGSITHANIDRLLIETDSPYLAPAPSHRGEQNEPSYLRDIATKASNILEMPESEFCKLTYDNTLKFFGIKSRK